MSISTPVSRFQANTHFELLFHRKNQDKQEYRVQATCTQCRIANSITDLLVDIIYKTTFSRTKLGSEAVFHHLNIQGLTEHTYCTNVKVIKLVYKCMLVFFTKLFN